MQVKKALKLLSHAHGTAIEVDAATTEFPHAKGTIRGKRGTVDELLGECDREEKVSYSHKW